MRHIEREGSVADRNVIPELESNFVERETPRAGAYKMEMPLGIERVLLLGGIITIFLHSLLGYLKSFLHLPMLYTTRKSQIVDRLTFL
jgi:hypothetical protein